MDILVNILEQMGLQGYAQFFRFWKDRKNLASKIPVENKHIVLLAEHSLTLIQKYLNIDQNIADMYLTFSEYIAYSLPKQGIEGIKKLIIETGQTLEKAETIKEDPWLNELAKNTFKNGEFGKIERLLT